MDYFKKIERSVTISADKRSTVDLQVDVWSQDLNVTKFILKLDTTDSAAINLTNATVRVAMVYSQDGQDVKIEAAGIVEDVATQKIAYVMSDKLAGFEGVVTAGFYVTLSTGQRIDIQNVTFNMCKSLLDKDLEAATENYYQTFDDIAKDVKNQADNQKSAMLAKTNEVKSYGDIQKTAINNIVKDVQSTGNTAKTQIGQVLPDVQSKVSAINTELAKIDENMPDLFVAYADNMKGSGFSKTDNTKMYKGYSVKNSNLPADYRWERNSSTIDIGGRNLFIDSGFKSSISTKTDYLPGKWYSYAGGTFNYPKYDNACNYLHFVTSGDSAIGIMQFFDTNKLVKGKTYSVRTWVNVDANTTFRYQLIKKNQNSSYNWYFNVYDTTVTTKSEWVEVAWTFDIPIYDDGIAYGVAIRNYKTGTETALRFLKPKFEIGNVYTGFSLAHEDLLLNASPINSVLTTLSAENPSTTLGGTWTQLGTETKFNNTIYYWKRTN